MGGKISINTSCKGVVSNPFGRIVSAWFPSQVKSGTTLVTLDQPKKNQPSNSINRLLLPLCPVSTLCSQISWCLVYCSGNSNLEKKRLYTKLSLFPHFFPSLTLEGLSTPKAIQSQEGDPNRSTRALEPSRTVNLITRRQRHNFKNC